MSKMEMVRAEMTKAMKSGEKERKEALSMLLAALKAKFIDKRDELTEDEENAVVLKEIKQTQETLDTAPADRADIREKCAYRIAVLKEFAPASMNEEEIRAAIARVLQDLGIAEPTARDKGRIMKNLMPLVNYLTAEKILMQGYPRNAIQEYRKAANSNDLNQVSEQMLQQVDAVTSYPFASLFSADIALHHLYLLGQVQYGDVHLMVESHALQGPFPRVSAYIV